jgi:hypothetical protein
MRTIHETETDEQVSAEDLKRVIEARGRKLLMERLANVERDIDATFSKVISDVILNLLGLTRSSFGRLEVDHCNGRQTAVANEIGALVKQHLDAQVPGWISKNLLGESHFVEEMRKAFVQEFKGRMGHAIREEAQREAQSIAKLRAREWVRQAMAQEFAEATQAADTATPGTPAAKVAEKRLKLAEHAVAAITVPDLTGSPAPEIE